MTKAIRSALLLGLLASGCGGERTPQAAGAGSGERAAAPASQPAAPPRVIHVFVSAESQGASPSALAQDWVRELNAAFAARPQQFKNVATPDEAESVVHIDSVVPTPDSPDHAVMSVRVTIGKTATPFRLDYTGGPAVMAGRFATHLVGQVEAARAAAAKSSAASPAPSAPPPSDHK
jgi:hypothetical protein